MGKHGKPAEFRVNGKVNLVKSTDIKGLAGVCTESDIVTPSTHKLMKGPLNQMKGHTTYKLMKGALNQRKGHTEGKLPFGYRVLKFCGPFDVFSSFLLLTFLLFVVCPLAISADPLISRLTNLYGEEMGKYWACRTFIAFLFIGLLFNFVIPIGIYLELDDKYAHENGGIKHGKT